MKNEQRFAVKVQGVTKHFRQGAREIAALRGVDLEVAEGNFTAIMGPSGSGKSTLLHIIAGLTAADSGSVEVDGVCLQSLSDRDLTLFRRRKIGVIFQAYNLVTNLTVRDNILLPLLLAGSQEDGQQLSALLARLGLSERADAWPDTLSGGEQQRVAIGRAVFMSPAIILADEPTGNLDSLSGQEICRLLRETCDRDGRTILLVTHEPGVARWADEIHVLKDGRIIDHFATAEAKDADALASRYQECIRNPSLAMAEAKP